MADYITTDQVKKINTLDPATTLTGNEDMVMQSGLLPYRAPLARVAGFCPEGTCATAKGTAAKVATLTGYIGTVLPNEFAIAFSNADEATGTHTIQVYNDASTPVSLGTLTVVDSCGTNVGAGALFGTIIFKVIGSGNSVKAFITNHDIREKTSTYTIKADGLNIYKTRVTDITLTKTGNYRYMQVFLDREIPYVACVNATFNTNSIQSTANASIDIRCVARSHDYVFLTWTDDSATGQEGWLDVHAEWY